MAGQLHIVTELDTCPDPYHKEAKSCELEQSKFNDGVNKLNGLMKLLCLQTISSF